MAHGLPSLFLRPKSESFFQDFSTNLQLPTWARNKMSLSIAPQPTSSQTPAFPSTKPSRRGNKNGPEHQYQITHDLIYKSEFHGDAYVSARLSRLQHGVFTHSNVHAEDALHVTFVAISFTFHSSNSTDHRFRQAVITIKAKNEGDGEPLKVLKFAPHLAFGKISSANMKWNFSLGASVGVSKATPADATVNGSFCEEKSVTVGAMMKIQGSTRSTPPSLSSPKRKPDTVLVWSLEENSQQEAGIPREFTFVFLLERPIPPAPNPPFTLSAPEDDTEKRMSISAPKTLADIIPIPDIIKSELTTSKLTPRTLPIPTTPSKHKHRFFGSLSTRKSSTTTKSRETSPSRTLLKSPKTSPPASISLSKETSPPPSFPRLPRFARREAVDASKLQAFQKVVLEKQKREQEITAAGIITSPTKAPSQEYDGIREELEHLSQNIASFSQETLHYNESHNSVDCLGERNNSLTPEQKRIFGPLRLSICVKPEITGVVGIVSTGFRGLVTDFEDVIVEGAVGQRFPTVWEEGCGKGVNTAGEGEEDCWVDGLFNFAGLTGGFEDLVELPGSSVSSVEPTLPGGRGGGDDR